MDFSNQAINYSQLFSRHFGGHIAMETNRKRLIVPAGLPKIVCFQCVVNIAYFFINNVIFQGVRARERIRARLPTNLSTGFVD
jgi:hypothetical protein